MTSIIEQKLAFYFSDGHATDNLTTFYDATKVDSINEIIDWDAVKSSYWGGQENLNMKRKKQAEFLIKDDIPTNCIKAYGCYNNSAKDKLINFGIDTKIVKVIPQSYY